MPIVSVVLAAAVSKLFTLFRHFEKDGRSNAFLYQCYWLIEGIKMT